MRPTLQWQCYEKGKRWHCKQLTDGKKVGFVVCTKGAWDAYTIGPDKLVPVPRNDMRRGFFVARRRVELAICPIA